jgi:hypothetical protein
MRRPSQYWGFDTREEWHKWHERSARKEAYKFQLELFKWLRGETSDIRRGTNAMRMARTAKAVISDDPSLLLPENKDKLRKESITSDFDG